MAAAGVVDSVPEGAAVSAVTDILLGEDDEAKHAVLDGFLSGDGYFESVPCKLLLLIIFDTHEFLTRIPQMHA
jgi:hypothetical protein